MKKEIITIKIFILLIIFTINNVYSQNNLLNKLSIHNNSKYSLKNINIINNNIYSFKDFSKNKNTNDSISPVWLPISEIIGVNTLVGSFNTYVAKDDWARISFKTVWNNLQHLPEFDHDNFETNFFQHPYHGSIYFNSARSNGYSFWWSTLFTFCGSLMWEYVMENTRPSWNDLINTTISGYMLGEMTHRVSNLLLGEKGNNCQANSGLEILAFALDPMQLLNRWIRGDLNKSNKKINKNENLKSDFSDIYLYTGYDNLLNYHSGEAGVIGGNINYGDVFNKKKIKWNPFGVFRINFNINLFNNNRPTLNYLDAYAILFGKNYYKYNQDSTKKNILDSNSNLLMGLFQHYDYWENSIFRFGGISFGLGLITKLKFNEDYENVSKLFINFMPLGAVNSVFRTVEEKNYSYGIGTNAKLETRFDLFNELVKIYFILDGFWYHIFEAANDGNTGNEFIGVFRPKLIFSPIKFASIGAEYLLYGRLTSYDFPNIYANRNKPVEEYRLFVGFNFTNSKTN